MEFLLGNEAIARGAVDAGAHSAYSYPGTPASEILPAFREYAPDRYSQWSLNEKTALELAIAEAFSGRKTLCAMKQVGLNASADPLFSAAYTGVKGALVIVTADDPGPYSSQTEQDSRMYAFSARLPVFDPSSPSDAYRLTMMAFELSTRFQTPVLLRPVMRVCHTRESMDLPAVKKASLPQPVFERDIARWAATPKFRSMLHSALLKKLDDIAASVSIDIPCKKKTAVIASGYAYSLVKDIESEFSGIFDLIKIDMPYPMPMSAIEKIEASYEKIIILEETFPVMENQFLDKRKITGKWNGCVPLKGEMTLDTVRGVLALSLGGTQKACSASSKEIAPAARPTLCAGCGHRPSFYAMKKAFPDGIFPGDIGCYTLGVNLGAVDTVLVMGASVSFAESLSRANPEKPVIASIGDSTFFHSGITPLINAFMSQSSFVLCILDNSTTAMTGFQPVPHANGVVSIERILDGIGIKHLRILDPYNVDEATAAVKDAYHISKENKSPSVIIFRHPCVTRGKIRGKSIVEINAATCKNCKICYEKFECPALSEDKKTGKAAVNKKLCTGCMVCVNICPFKAISEASHA
jgi:indolepyruvate ferredoxin oxidoreductase, alpha subunit